MVARDMDGSTLHETPVFVRYRFIAIEDNKMFCGYIQKVKGLERIAMVDHGHEEDAKKFIDAYNQYYGEITPTELQ